MRNIVYSYFSCVYRIFGTLHCITNLCFWCAYSSTGSMSEFSEVFLSIIWNGGNGPPEGMRVEMHDPDTTITVTSWCCAVPSSVQVGDSYASFT